MFRKIAAISFLVVFCISAKGDDMDDNAIYMSFQRWTKNVYLSKNEDMAEMLLSDDQYRAHVLGYSLGNLLQYARRGSENHKIWLMLESQVKESIFSKIEREGILRGRDRASIEKRQQRAWTACMAAQQGWLDAEMMVLTKVDPKNAPNFFESLRKGDIADDKPDKKVFRDLVASDILVKEHEIGSGFFLSRDMGTYDHKAEVEFMSEDKKISIYVYIVKMKNLETYQKDQKNNQLKMQEYASKTNYEVDRLNLGETTYIRKIGQAAYDAESYPGQLWRLWVRGKYFYSSSDYDSRREEDEENAPKVKLAVTNAITAMYNRVIAAEGR